MYLEKAMLTNTNISKCECAVRLLTGVLISILYVTGSIAGGMAHFLAAIGIILVATGMIHYYPLHLAWNTSGKENSRA